MRLKFVFAVLTVLIATTPAFADVKLPAVISTHMVIQAKSHPRIWGWAEPSENIEVEYLGTTAKTTANSSGQFEVFLDEIAPGTIFDLEIRGRNKILVQDVLAGEVWVCSGQSNMAFPLAAASTGTPELSSKSPPNVRFFKVSKAPLNMPSDNVQGQWQTFNSQSAMGWSAVGYFFAKKLSSHLREPVGMIQASVGGTSIITWLSPDVMRATFLQGITIKAPSNKTTPGAPSCLYNGMINGVTSCTINGIIWYQGEADVSQASAYKILLPALINDWRSKWQNSDLPFLFVQLPNLIQKDDTPERSKWAELREAQSQALTLKNTAMVVTIDVGDPKNLHPTNKEPVGDRLALSAMSVAYHEKVPYQGPVMDTIKVSGESLVLHFKNAYQGLNARDNQSSASASVKGFYVCDTTGKYFPAEAQIDGEKVIVSSKEVQAPTAVKYAWNANPDADLENGMKFPAAPFRASVTGGNESMPIK